MAQGVRDRGDEALRQARDTIFALSSGAPPAAIAVVRISGADAHAAARLLAGRLPAARHAALRTLRAPATGKLLDRALVLVFDAPASSTGEDMVELHLHGGRAVIDAVAVALAALPGMRAAEAGEFTRRAFANGRLDLIEAEGLADLLAAETEQQRRLALAATDGSISARVDGWRTRLLQLSAAVEALIDFDEEDDVRHDLSPLREQLQTLVDEWSRELAQPSAERLRDAVTVVLAGPTNAGKSALFNVLVARDAMIVSPIAGTTRDVGEAEVQHRGRAFRLIDTAGWNDASEDPIELEGIRRGRQAAATADVVVWMGDDAWTGAGDAVVVPVHAWCDLAGRSAGAADRLSVSAITGSGVEALWDLLHASAPRLTQGAIAFNRRQREGIALASSELAAPSDDPLLMAEQLRMARLALDRVVGRAGVEEMLDQLFGRFCIGK